MGPLGAAGVVLVRRDPRDGRPMSVLLRKRGSGTNNFGVWDIPSGTIQCGETMREAALRGAGEEVGLPAADAAARQGHRHKWVEFHAEDAWTYTTVFADVLPGPDGKLFSPRALAETADYRWVPIFMVEHFAEKLLPAFERHWPEIKKRIPKEPSPQFPKTKALQGLTPAWCYLETYLNHPPHIADAAKKWFAEVSPGKK